MTPLSARLVELLGDDLTEEEKARLLPTMDEVTADPEVAEAVVAAVGRWGLPLRSDAATLAGTAVMSGIALGLIVGREGL